MKCPHCKGAFSLTATDLPGDDLISITYTMNKGMAMPLKDLAASITALDDLLKACAAPHKVVPGLVSVEVGEKVVKVTARIVEMTTK